MVTVIDLLTYQKSDHQVSVLVDVVHICICQILPMFQSMFHFLSITDN